jgi:fucose permease
MKTNYNKGMFVGGIILIAVTAILLLGDFLDADSSAPVMFGFLGMLFIATSGVRPLKK